MIDISESKIKVLSSAINIIESFKKVFSMYYFNEELVENCKKLLEEIYKSLNTSFENISKSLIENLKDSKKFALIKN
jgi:hypothetical protein